MKISETKKAEIKTLEDKDLVKAILSESNREKKRKLQEELYVRYADTVYKKCKSIIKNSETAKDLAHDILVKVFLKLNKFRGESSFYSWVYAITFNHCMTHIEKEKRLKIEDFETHSYEIATDEIELEHKILKEVRLTQLETVFEYLPEAERLILIMRYQDGVAVKNIAKHLNIGESAVKMRLKRSRDHLAKLIKENAADHEEWT